MKVLLVVAGCVLGWAGDVIAQGPAAVGSARNPRQVTSLDLGPDIDPGRLVGTRYEGVPLFRTFRSFVSGSYATAGVWVYAAGDDQASYDAEVTYPYPRFYRPTWGELFDCVARQMRCAWSWNPENRQFEFRRSGAEPFFGVTLAEGWVREDRGSYVWHAPKGQDFGMDIYYYGHYTASADEPELFRKVRTHLALANVSGWPNPPTVDRMSTIQVAGVDALYLRTDTPRPDGVWRQWSLVVDGHAFVIVSAMPKVREADLVPAVEQMVASFKVKAAAAAGPATRSAG